ncbi:MAG: acireductone synthase [Gammaproteobacteria bacterium]|nr:acireductone synthase [Gammaproteobacteria bacterium]
MIKAIVTDIEGTTTSLSFVKEILFPYARKNMGDFVKGNYQRPKVAALIKDVETEAGCSLTLEETIEQLINWIDEDKKITPLKALQGLIWEAGYTQGDYTGHVYDDAHQYLDLWHKQGLRLYVYSSGSVYAQKLLYGHTAYGDMTPLFSDYFDTKIGAKTEVNSYRSIVESVGFAADGILFLSDIVLELDAAAEAGMRTILLDREEDCTSNQSQHICVDNFANINFN